MILLWIKRESNLKLEKQLVAHLEEIDVEQSAQQGVAPADFFQKVYKDSALEGLVHISPASDADLLSYVTWLKTQNSAPTWGKQLMSEFAEKDPWAPRKGWCCSKDGWDR